MTDDGSTQEHIAALRDSVAAFVAGHDHQRRLRAVRGHPPGYDRAVWAELAQLGWLGILVPEQYGGLGLGLQEAAVVAEELARSTIPEPFTAASVLATGAIVHGDCPALKMRLLPDIVSGTLLPALAWQETNDQIDPLQAATTARAAASDIHLDGRKRFIAGGAGAHGFVVSACAADGVALYWVPADAPGLVLTHEPLADGTFATTATLTDVRVTVEQCVASPARTAQALPLVLDEALVVAGAELLGVSTSALDATLEYLRVRKQFGKPIGSFQALQHRAVDCYVQHRLADGVLREALLASTSPQTAAARAALASRVKARCSEAALLITREAVQMHGAMGFTDACDVSLYVKRTLVLSGWLGSATAHRRRYARSAPLPATDTPRAGTEVERRLEDWPRDTDWDALPDEEFRLLFRNYIERHYPEDLRYLPRRVRWHEVREWNCKLAALGWIAPAWPRAWGGMELSPAKQIIYIDELERWGVGRAPDQGVRQLGPALMRYGTPEQQREFLPKILSCEHVWCQGYSEPNAGSDLASVSTSAVIKGGEIVINGRKIWTSMAMDSTHIYVLCRTDTTVKKQEGISFVMVDLATPGITVRPILDIAGNEEFCEVTFDDVRTSVDNLVGGLNKGWSVAKSVLDFERLGISSPWRPQIAFSRLAKLGAKLGLFDDLGFMDRFTALRLDLLDQATLYSQFAELARRGQSLGADVSILKIWGMEAFQRVTEFALVSAGTHGAAGTFVLDEERIDLLTPFYMARLITIGGGSNEIQRNIVSRHVLKLPT